MLHLRVNKEHSKGGGEQENSPAIIGQILAKGRLIVMVLKTAKGDKEIKTKELDFTNLMCDLEDNGVDVMALLDDEKRENMKIFGTVRAIMGAITGTKDLTKAGKMLSEHLKYGGSIDDVMNVFTEAMNNAGFGESAAEQ